ncbi:MAG: DUF2969 family protein [Alkalibacterium gilvum]|uniref:DUF2969 domain-containing protein n=1 Tax=Alkalibacterium gilvum TaxID=1130080 RepID=A0A1H6VV94_9LACT|nr:MULTISPECIES: DUF2969 family protein [Alkalibacterium]MDN6288616.1 DUF2969 domain-containing protein [Lactococcus lactis]MDN6194368.1 DUF2969 domain-containing protein [Alkalibacterium sp.]MDN6296226.1 DUF2969 domain-containing protein [Alkalibacterium sp.]MDN6730369.1 DUF2969 domain-containing protein [Alkalibacterium sp.]SEJ06974.1 Protein of unknown function [Alkalibacterium gilvum]
MGKRNKNIEVEINETKNNTETYTEYELLVRKKAIGTLQQEGDGLVNVIFKSGKKRTAQTIDEGVQMIIEEYNLHD